MRQVYLAATGHEPRQDHGRARAFSTASCRRGLQTGFMKPVGQRTVIEDGVPADEDAVLMRDVFGLPDADTR